MVLTLKELRRKHGLSAAALAAKTGVSLNTIESVERRGDCKLSTAFKICAALGEPLDAICTSQPPDKISED